MRKLLFLSTLFISCHLFGQTAAYENAWKSLNENKWAEASQWLNTALNDNAVARDAYITKLYLESYSGNEEKIKDFYKSIYTGTPDSYPYIYALWFNQFVAGAYGKKQADHQLTLLNQLTKDDKAPGTLVAAANYQMGMHYLFSNDAAKSDRYYAAIGNIKNWQYTGPFENLSKSGHYKNYGPYEQAGTDAIFKSASNADIKWFAPPSEIKDGWTPLCYQVNSTTAVAYVQNFVNSPADQDLYCCIGATGSIKVWINDELVISESEERTTELDTYIVRCHLSKGANRVLIQLGYTNNTFPNFCLRFTDEKFRPAPGIEGSSVFASYPKITGSTKKYEPIKPFAEEYFLNSIKKTPGNLVNYLLLADVYLRNKKVIEARNLITEAISKAPGNCLLKMKMAEILIKEGNRTLLLEEIEKIKQLDPESLLVMELNIKEYLESQKYEDASREIAKRISKYGEDESTMEYQITLLVQEKKYEDLIKYVEKAYEKYPENLTILNIMYNIKKEVYKDRKAAMQVYESFLKNNYNYSAVNTYSELLTEQGDNEKALSLKRKIAEQFPYSPTEFYNISKYYYESKQYDKAEEYIKKSLNLSPYNEVYWGHLGDIKSEKTNTTEALNAYRASLKHDPNQYEIINKIRKLNGKPEIHKLFPETDVNELIKNDNPSEAKNTDYGYYYILMQKNAVMYPGGATEEHYSYIIRITNEKGVDQYKESTIGYGDHQNLLIEKAEVIKKNKTRIDGEKNGNEIVFTNLEPGDVIIYQYRLRNYVYGRLAKEYWDKYYFGGQIYKSIVRYNLLVPADQKINYISSQSEIKSSIKNVEDFKQYSWEIVKGEPDKDEPLMPSLVDVTKVLHISTIPSWQQIADWYNDISNNKAEEDFELIALYKQLFPDGGKSSTQFKKAKLIYDYIESNIRYSSVSFRQSAYVPQRPSVTLTTRLGDCKDLSSLFTVLARMAGINAQMVLVDTRDNGQKDILLPSVEFNHCIVKAELDNKPYYIELTDNYLPFASLPNNLNGAIILEIPYSNKNSEKAELQLLQAENRTKDRIKRIVDIKPSDTDLDITVKTVKSGNPSSGTRYTYVNLDNEKQLKEMEKVIAGAYKNIVKMQTIGFSNLDKLNDSVEYVYAYKVKNEISEIGSLKTFRIVYPDVVASLNNFSDDNRTYPIQYWSYEDVDQYETTVNINLPPGKTFTELPVSENLTFKDMKFSVQYTLKAPDKLVVTRKFSNNRQNIPASDYAAFKAFFEKIVRAEQKFIAYK